MPVAPHAWSPAADELAGKTILVTGAAEGIGRAASLAFASRGAEVLLLSRNEARLEDLYDEIVDLITSYFILFEVIGWTQWTCGCSQGAGALEEGPLTFLRLEI